MKTLLNPGPVNVSARVRRAKPDLCHREPDYLALQEETRGLLRSLFAPLHLCAMITGSGTAAVEMALASMPGRFVVLSHGVYGARMVEMCRTHRVDSVELKAAWTEPPDLDRVRATVQAGDVLAWVHHETTTGMIFPSRDLARLAHDAGAITLVDAVSALGGEDFDAREQDVVVATANKCIQGLPGVAFALVRPELVPRMTQRSVYLHLPRYLDGVPFTPAVQTVLALREALLELREETVAGRIARYRRAAGLLRRGFERLGYEFVLPPQLRSNTLTALTLNEPYPTLHDRCREAGFVIYKGQAEGFFRVANMGWIPASALKRFLEVLGCAR